MKRDHSKAHWNWTGRAIAGVTLSLLISAPASAAGPQIADTVGGPKVKYHGLLAELPVGSVQPRGWIQAWLERQARGLTGHPENLAYPYDTALFTGHIPRPATASKWWKAWWPYEQAGYLVDATTRLSWLIEDESLNQRRDANIDYILHHSTGGSLGPSSWPWPNAVVSRALLAQLDATEDPRVEAVLNDWLQAGRNEILKGGRNGANFEAALQLYGMSGNQQLLALSRSICEGYLTASNSFCTRQKILSDAPFREHGVTAAETLKCLPMIYLYTGDEEILRLARRAYQKVAKHNLMPDGGMVSAEYLEPVAFDSLHESCDLTDWSWSIGYLLLATAEARWGDLIERATFNALPGAVTKDFRQLQYFSAANQLVAASTLSGVPHCQPRMSYRAGHDTECCGGNISRAMPNYVIRMWARAADGGLAAVCHGPSEVTTTVHGQRVTITTETAYPFRDRITFRIRAAAPVRFNLHLRIPEWCEQAAIKVNDDAAGAACPRGGFAVLNREFRDGDQVTLDLPMTINAEPWLGNTSVVVTRGPLVYSVQPDEVRVERTTDTDHVKTMLPGKPIRQFPAVEFFPASEWRFGFDPVWLKHIKVIESALKDNPYVAAEAPVRLLVPLVELPNWAAAWRATPPGAGKETPPIPRSPGGIPGKSVLMTKRNPVNMVMVPYGATHLRLTTLPVVSGPTPASAQTGRPERAN